MTINVIVCKKFARQQLQILPSVYFVRSVIDDLLLLLFIKEHKKAHKRGKLNLKSSKELGFYTKVFSSREGFFFSIMFVLLYIILLIVLLVVWVEIDSIMAKPYILQKRLLQ